AGPTQAAPAATAAFGAGTGRRTVAMRLCRRRRARHRRCARGRDAGGRRALGLSPGRGRSGNLAERCAGRHPPRPARTRRVAARKRSSDDVMSDADDFTAKWRAQWPEWNIGAVFLPEAQREAAFAWLALLQELTDAAWGGTDATPGLAKLA